MTDACVVLGWLDPDHPLADDVRLDRAAASRAIATLGTDLGRPAAAAAGIVAVAAAVMARALKRVSVARGVDPRRMALLPFGGAGPLFGCALADALGMRTVVVPPHPGALSALGLAAAAERVEAVASVHRRLDAVSAAAIEDGFAALVDRVRAELPDAIVRRQADCRYEGQGYEVPVAVLSAEPALIAEVFGAAHRARYGFAAAGSAIELVNLRVVAERGGQSPDFRRSAAPSPSTRRGERREIVVRGAAAVAEIWPLDDLPPGVTISGPAVLAGGDATALVEPGWLGTAHASGALVLERR